MDSLFLEDFELYRLKEAEKAAAFIRQAVNGSASPDYLKGAMALLKQIIDLPYELAANDEQKSQAQLLKESMLAKFEAQAMRRFLE